MSATAELTESELDRRVAAARGLADGETDVLHESAFGVLQEGTIKRAGKGLRARVTLITEGFGNERDGHYYPGRVLEEALPLFNTGKVKMYIGHLTEAQRKALAGMPRNPLEHGARILENSCTIGVNSEGRKTVEGEALIAHPELSAIVEADPQALGVSIDARGRAEDRMIEGRRAREVQKISRVLSTDFVSEAGAGGQINELVEALVEAAEREGADMPAGTATEPLAGEQTDEATTTEAEDQGGWEPVVGDDTEPATEAEVCTECGAELMAEAAYCAGCGASLEAIRESASEREDPLEGFTEEELDDLEEAIALKRRRGGDVADGGPLGSFKHHHGAHAGPGDLNGPENEQDKHGGLDGGGDAKHLDEVPPGHRRKVYRDPRHGVGDHAGSRPNQGRFSMHDENAGAHGSGHHHRRRHMHEDDAELEAGFDEIEEIAEARAAEMLAEAVEAAVAARDEEFETRERAMVEAHEAELTRVSQRYKVAAIVEAARTKGGKALPAGAQRSLKERFYDQLFEAEEHDGTVVKTADQVLQEAVHAAIVEKIGEVQEFREARVTDAGDTAVPPGMPGGERTQGVRKPRGLDASINRELGLAPPAPKGD